LDLIILVNKLKPLCNLISKLKFFGAEIFPLPFKDIEVNHWVRVRLTTISNEQQKSIFSKMEIDWKDGAGFIKCLEHKYTNLENYMVKKSDFENISYTWWRINNKDTGSISIRNIVQTAL
jgi:hypothetical protein